MNLPPVAMRPPLWPAHEPQIDAASALRMRRTHERLCKERQASNLGGPATTGTEPFGIAATPSARAPTGASADAPSNQIFLALLGLGTLAIWPLIKIGQLLAWGARALEGLFQDAEPIADDEVPLVDADFLSSQHDAASAPMRELARSLDETTLAGGSARTSQPLEGLGLPRRRAHSAGACPSPSQPGFEPNAKPELITTVSNLSLSPRNATVAEEASNRRRYIDSMSKPRVWASELELGLLAKERGVRLQLWLRQADGGGHQLYQVCGDVESEQVANMVHVGGNHYRALLETAPLGRNASRVRLKDTRSVGHFDEIDVRGAGDCALLAFAYSTDAPHARTLIDLFNEHRRRPESRALCDLRTHAQLCRDLGVDGNQSTNDGALVLEALDQVANQQRRIAVRLLRAPENEGSLNAAVVAELVQAAEENGQRGRASTT